jgi:hypothetical protein
MTEPHNVMSVSREKRAWSVSGYLMLLLFVALLALTVWRPIAFGQGAVSIRRGSMRTNRPWAIVLFTGLRVLGLILIAKGFYMISPTRRSRSRCSALIAAPTGMPACAGYGHG